jgi:hypothetical protein
MDRLCISGSKWTRVTLDKYRIAIQPVDDETFFGYSLDSVRLNLSTDILNCQNSDECKDVESERFIAYLTMANSPESEESAVDDFASRLFSILGYDGKGRFIRTRKRIELLMCSTYTQAETDVCVLYRQNLLFLLQEDKSFVVRHKCDPEPQVIAECIAAFQNNNMLRAKVGKPMLKCHTFPAVTMIGTSPTFYLVAVTNVLNRAIEHGIDPEVETKILRYDPFKDDKRLSLGMVPPDRRKKILKAFVAMKDKIINFE